jgi:hypothetical protein
MPLQEPKHAENKAGTKHRSPKSATENLDRGAQPQTQPAAIIQRAILAPGSLAVHDVLQLQRTIGNQMINRLLTGSLIQRKVEKWEDISVRKGTTVYHVTSPEHANNIIKNGMKQVQNAFGGGRLGSGFYTHRNSKSAALYTQTESPITLEFTLTRDANGQIAPQNVYVSDTEGLDYVKGNDFITAEEDNEELKFHSSDCLELVAVHQGGQRFALDEWLEFME